MDIEAILIAMNEGKNFMIKRRLAGQEKIHMEIILILLGLELGQDPVIVS